MRRRVLNEYSLTPAEERFVGLIARGYTQRQAAKEAFPSSNLSDNGYDQKGSRIRKRPAVEARMRALLDAAKIEDLYSVGRWQADLLRFIEKADAEGNLTVAAQFMRLAGQALGILKDRVIVAAEQTMTDADLVSTLAGDDEAKAATLRAVIGAASFGIDEVKKAA